MHCQICQEEGHAEDTCPNFRVEKNIFEVRREIAALENTITSMNEYADKLGEDTNESIAKFKSRVEKLFRPLIGEVYATIGREMTRKGQHVAGCPRRSGTEARRPPKANDTEPEQNGAGARVNDPGKAAPREQESKNEQRPRFRRRAASGQVPTNHKTQIAKALVKQEPICGVDPRKVLDKEEWEDMVDFLVFWDALDVGDEKELEGEVKELHDRFPVGETLNEGTEERDMKFLQLEKTKKFNSIFKKSSKNRGAEGQDKSKVQKYKQIPITQEDERWAGELQRRERCELARQELGEKLAEMHEEGFEDGFLKGKLYDKTDKGPEPKDKDGLLDFCGYLELVSDQQRDDILENVMNFLKEKVEEHKKRAKYEASLCMTSMRNTLETMGPQLQEYGSEDGYIWGRIVRKDARRRLSRSLNEMMDEFYKTVSFMNRTGAAKRETAGLMTIVKRYLDEAVTKHTTVGKGAENVPTYTYRRKRNGPQVAEAGGSDRKEGKEQVRLRSMAVPSDESMEEAAVKGGEKSENN